MIRQRIVIDVAVMIILVLEEASERDGMRLLFGRLLGMLLRGELVSIWMVEVRLGMMLDMVAVDVELDSVITSGTPLAGREIVAKPSDLKYYINDNVQSRKMCI